MGDARTVGHESPHGRVRDRRAARLGSDDDARPLPVAVVRTFVGAGCHLCEAALEVIEGVRSDIPFELDVVEIDGDAELEARYRELLPVVEIDGERAFTWFVEPEALRERLLRPGRGRSGTM